MPTSRPTPLPAAAKSAPPSRRKALLLGIGLIALLLIAGVVGLLLWPTAPSMTSPPGAPNAASVAPPTGLSEALAEQQANQGLADMKGLFQDAGLSAPSPNQATGARGVSSIHLLLSSSGALKDAPMEETPAMSTATESSAGPAGIHLLVRAPMDVVAGTPFPVEVSASDAAGDLALGYAERVMFFDSDRDDSDEYQHFLQFDQMSAGRQRVQVLLREPGLVWMTAISLVDNDTRGTSGPIVVHPASKGAAAFPSSVDANITLGSQPGTSHTEATLKQAGISVAMTFSCTPEGATVVVAGQPIHRRPALEGGCGNVPAGSQVLVAQDDVSGLRAEDRGNGTLTAHYTNHGWTTVLRMVEHEGAWQLSDLRAEKQGDNLTMTFTYGPRSEIPAPPDGPMVAAVIAASTVQSPGVYLWRVEAVPDLVPIGDLEIHLYNGSQRIGTFPLNAGRLTAGGITFTFTPAHPDLAAPAEAPGVRASGGGPFLAVGDVVTIHDPGWVHHYDHRADFGDTRAHAPIAFVQSAPDLQLALPLGLLLGLAGLARGDRKQM